MLSFVPLPAGDSELVQIVDAAFADAARRAGPLLACRIGCTQCCHGAFAINALDAARLRAGMESLRVKEPRLAATIERRARAWIDAYGPNFPGDGTSGVLGTTDAEQARFEEFAADAACPALDPATGRCDVYEWRPMTCRIFGPPIRATGEDGSEGLGHCELCFAGATPEHVAECEMQVPHGLEAELLQQMDLQTDSGAETVVAFGLLGSF